MLKSINPANGKLIRSYPEMTNEEVDEVLHLVNDVFNEWRETSFNVESLKCS